MDDSWLATWQNCVSARLFMWREGERVGHEGGSLEMSGQEVNEGCFCTSSCELVIRREGLFGV